MRLAMSRRGCAYACFSPAGTIAFSSPTHMAVAPATETGMAKKLTTGIIVISRELPPKP